MNRFLLMPLGAACLLAAPLVGAQPPSPAATESCVIAGPSHGACRALGRYAQGYRDVEGGLRGDAAAVSGHRRGGFAAPAHPEPALAQAKDEAGSGAGREPDGP